MEWLKKLIEKHTKDGVLNQEEFIKEVNTEFPKNAVPKDTYNTLAETKTKLEKDIADRDKQLEDLKKVDAEGLQAKIDQLQKDNKAAQEKYESELKDITLSNAVKLALSGKVHDEDIVSGLVDKTKLIVGDGGKVVGLDEQITTLKTSKGFLFKEDDGGTPPAKPGFQIGNPPKPNSAEVNAAISAAFGNVKE